MNISGDNTEGTVTDLRPYTSYDCSIFAVTKFGGPSSDFITVETPEGGGYSSYSWIRCQVCNLLLLNFFIVPSAPVITAVTAIDSQSVLVTWRAPAEPNGVITSYTITYNTGGSSNFINVSFNGETVCANKCLKLKLHLYTYAHILILDSIF